MAKEGFKRKLIAIFSTDVAGYSHLLMGEESSLRSRPLRITRGPCLP